MSERDQPRPGDPGWVTLADGIRFSHRWLAENTPALHQAWQRADTLQRRRELVTRILRAAADAESEPTAGAGETAPGQLWVAIAAQVDSRLTDGADWPMLAAALTRAHAAGYDVPTKLPALAAIAPLPSRHPARDLHWRLLADCDAALPARTPAQPAPSPPARSGVPRHLTSSDPTEPGEAERHLKETHHVRRNDHHRDRAPDQRPGNPPHPSR